jgi:2-methylcitrate dehydratase PrpD
MDCALKIKQKYSPKPAEITEIVCRTAEGPVHRLWEPLADKQKPVSSYGAKFSLPYSIAVMIVRGRAGLEEFTEAAIRDPAVLDLARKVRYVLDPTIDYPRHFSGHVKVTLQDGTVLEENQAHPRGVSDLRQRIERALATPGWRCRWKSGGRPGRNQAAGGLPR